MDAKEKQLELDRLIGDSKYREAAKVAKNLRVYETESDTFVRFHDVATVEKFLGFVAVAVPNPNSSAAEQLETLVELYGDAVIVKSCLNAIAIKQQQDSRKIAKGGPMKLSNEEFLKRVSQLDAEIIGRLKTGEYIRKHVEEEWQAERESSTISDGELRIF